MSEHRATIQWQRESQGFSYETYNRGHRWSFDGGVEVAASAAPAYRGDPDRVDPEEAFVASIASCHMLTFLALAAGKRLVVDSYADEAIGFMEKNEKGRLAITRVTLRPKIAFGGEKPPSEEQISKLHELAHEQCFIANSVKTKINVAGAKH
jgi:organic hydroperoxide reductase OsmC/OhrA